MRFGTANPKEDATPAGRVLPDKMEARPARRSVHLAYCPAFRPLIGFGFIEASSLYWRLNPLPLRARLLIPEDVRRVFRITKVPYQRGMLLELVCQLAVDLQKRLVVA